MVSSLLTATKGEVPTASPFDLSNETYPSIKDIWSPPMRDVDHGELWIAYPFEERYFSLDKHTRDPELAAAAKSQIALHLDAVVDEADRRGIGKVAAKWVVDELLTNATQYGQISETTKAAGMVRVEWFIDQDESGPTLAVAVANPCIALFDPSRFARMESAEFFAMDNPSLNGHLGTIGVLSYVKENTTLTYLWEMASGERVKLTMREIPENAPDRPENYDDLMKPTRVEVFKFDVNNQPIPYSFEQFQRDIEGNVAAESVTVSCVIEGARASAKAEGL